MDAIKKCIFAILMLSISFTQVNAAGTLIARGQFGGRMDIESQDVKVTINNGIAVTEVIQVFVNKEDRVAEALYSFPVPKNASVANFSMWIDGKEMIGEVLEKKRAREIYESYKPKRVDPGLLEQVDYKNFEMRIFPIPAKGKQKIRLTYYQEIDVDNDWGTFTYPLSQNTDGYVSSRTTGRFSLNMNIKSAVPITQLESNSHNDDFAMVKHTNEYWQASLEVKEGDLNRDVVLAYKLERPQTGFDIICSKENNLDGYFCMTVTAGKELNQIQKGMDYVFLLDISGSMKNDLKLGNSTQSIASFVRELGPEDRFEMLTFNVGVNKLFNNLSPVTVDSKQSAQVFLERQRAKGGTDLRPAIQQAYSYRDPDRQLNVIVLSDGMTEQGSTSELMSLVQQRPDNTHVFCIGVGNDVNRPLLKDIAGRSGGLAAFISRGDDFERQAKSFRRKLLRPAISNIKIKFSENVYDVEPKEIPNLYHGMPVRIYGRYKNSGSVNISMSGDLQGREFKQTMTVDFPKQDDSNPEIERMWAWQKVQRLLQESDRHGDRTGNIPEIIRLGEAYSIVTEYTSFLVLENDQEYKRWKIDRKNMLRIKRDRKSQEKLQDQLKELRQKVDRNIGPDDQPDEVIQKQPAKTNSSPQNQQVRSRPISRNLGGGAIGPIEFLIASLLLGGTFIRRKKK